MIHAVVVGNLGGDPELKFSQSGTQILSFSVASTDGYSDKKTTTWVRCALFGKRGESLSQMLGKGDRVAVRGSMRQREFTDKHGEVKRSLELTCDDVELLGGRDRGERVANDGRNHEKQAARAADPFTDDLPF